MAATITPAVGRADRIIHTAAREGNVERIRQQVALGESFRAVDSEGRVPLHIAVIHAQVEAVALLLELGEAWIPRTEDEFASPLHLAASMGNAEVMSLILNHYPPESLIELKDLFGRTAADLAIRSKGSDCFGLILKKGTSKTVLSILQESISGRSSYFSELPKEQVNPKTFLTSSEAGQSEKKLYDTLVESFKSEDRSQQISCLTALAAFFLERGDEWRAACVLNSAYAVAKDESISNECRRVLINLIEQVEIIFIQNKLQSTVPYQNRIREHRIRLHEIRERSATTLSSNGRSGGDLLSTLAAIHPNTSNPKANMAASFVGGLTAYLDGRETVQKALRELTREYKAFLADLLQESIEIMGKKPPVRFAMVGLGSLSRSEICPYSDAEFIFLIESSSEEVKDYFRLLTELMRLKITNLGETEFKLIQTDQGDHSLTPAGFSMDIGGLSPLGKKGLYELIGTPQELAHFQTEEWLRDHDAEIILVNAMRTACFISGEASLFEGYQKEVHRILDDRGTFSDWISFKPRLRQKRAIELMGGFLEEFAPQFNSDRVGFRAFDVKKELYRLPQNVISSLALYFGIKKNGSFEQLVELGKQKIISSKGVNRLWRILEIVFDLRMRTHLFYRSECEILYYNLKGGDRAGKHLFFINQKLRIELQSVYSVLIPLQNAAIEFVNGNEKAFATASLSDASVARVGSKRIPNLLRGNHPSSSNSRTTSSSDPLPPAILNPNSLSSLLHLGATQFDQLQFEPAIQAYEEALLILNARYGDEPTKETALVLFSLGAAHLASAKIEEGIEYFLSAILMQKRMKLELSEKQLKTLSDLGEMARIFSRYPDFEKGLRFCNLSLSILREVHSGKPHPEIAKTLTSIGNLCEKHQKFTEALDHYNSALLMYQELYQNEPHIDIAQIFERIGIVHRALNAPQEAIQPWSAALSICRALYGETPNKNTKNMLLKLGALYGTLGDMPNSLELMAEGLMMKRVLKGERATLKLAEELKTFGELAQLLNQLNRVVQLYTATLSIYRVHKNESRFTFPIVEKLAQTHIQLNNHQQAIEYQTEVVSTLKEMAAPSLTISRALDTLATSYRAAGDGEKARALSQESATIMSDAMGRAMARSCAHQ